MDYKSYLTGVKDFRLKSPTYVKLELTERCDNRCLHCYLNENAGGGFYSDINNIKKVIDVLADAKVFRVIFTGGEPFMVPKKLWEGIDIALKNKIKVSVNTNGNLIKEKDVQKLARLNVPVLVSLHGHKAEIHDKIVGNPGAFDSVVSTLKRMVEYKVHVSVNMVVQKSNLEFVSDTGLFVSSLGINKFAATPLSPTRKEHFNISLSVPDVRFLANELNSLEKKGVEVDILEPIPLCALSGINIHSKIRKRRCTAGFLSAAITPRGDIKACTHSNISYGNIFNEGLFNSYNKMLKEWQKIQLPTICRNCPSNNLCGGGCREAARTLGDINGPDPLCTGEYVPVLNNEPNKRLVLPKKLKVAKYLFRKDINCYTVLTFDNTVIFLNNVGFDLLCELQKLGSFSVSDFKSDSKVLKWIKYLFAMKLLKKAE